MKIQGNNYIIDNKKKFIGNESLKSDYSRKAFKFAYDMSFGKKGEHRSYRSGGSHRRSTEEIFVNTLQGKIAEYCVYQYLIKNKVPITEPDTDTYALGEWDVYDFDIKGSLISVKSTKRYGNLLLLETKDYKENGVYIPNDKVYDFYILVRIDLDLESLFKKTKKQNENIMDFEELRNSLNLLCDNKAIKFDIPGYITKKHLADAVSESKIIYKGNKLNKYTTMDADNYYFESGELIDIEKLISEFK